LLFVVENGEGALTQSGDITSVSVCDGDGERDQVGVSD
jgi:hypothetical protein